MFCGFLLGVKVVTGVKVVKVKCFVDSCQPFCIWIFHFSFFTP